MRHATRHYSNFGRNVSRSTMLRCTHVFTYVHNDIVSNVCNERVSHTNVTKEKQIKNGIGECEKPLSLIAAVARHRDVVIVFM